MTSKKIILAIDTNTSGGAERVISILANHFSRKHNVILVNSDKKSLFYDIDPKVNIIKINLDFSRRGFFYSLKRFYCKTVFLFKLFNKEKPDAVIAFLTNMEFPAIVAAILSGTPIYTSIRNSIQSFGCLEILFRRLAYRYINGVVFQNKKTFNNPIFKNCKRKTIIFNPLSSKYCDVSMTSFRSNYNNWIINVGRLHPQKNQLLLIDAFESIANTYTDLELHIFGKGDLRNILEDKILKSKYSNRIFLEGEVKDAIIKYRNSLAFAMTSDFEGFPNSLFEAMAVGLPVICSDFDTDTLSSYIEQGKNGYLFPIGDKKRLVYALDAIINGHYDKKVIIETSKKIQSELSINSICEQWENFIFNKNL